MMKLILQARILNNNTVIVKWCTGLRTRGELTISELKGSQTEIRSELIAIQYLLFDKNVFKREGNLTSGKGMAICCSPSLKELESRVDGKYGELTPHFKMFIFPLYGCSVSSQTDFELDVLNNDNGEESGPLLKESITPEDIIGGYDVIETPSMGLIKITKHAIEQYTERLHSGEAQNPSQSLVKRLMNKGMKKRLISERVLKHKSLKYKSMNAPEIWGNNDSQMHFVVIREPDDDIGSLVTIYRRHPSYQ